MKRSIPTALALVAIAAPSASAQEDEVFVDPDSPAGTEYAVPLDQARREATGAGAGGGGTNAGGEAQPLFGVGIERESKRPAARTTARAKDKESRDGSEGAGSTPDTPSGQSAVAIEAAAGDGSGGLLTAGIAAGVLAAGLFAGFGLRRLLRDG